MPYCFATPQTESPTLTTCTFGTIGLISGSPFSKTRTSNSPSSAARVSAAAGFSSSACACALGHNAKAAIPNEIRRIAAKTQLLRPVRKDSSCPKTRSTRWRSEVPLLPVAASYMAAPRRSPALLARSSEQITRVSA